MKIVLKITAFILVLGLLAASRADDKVRKPVDKVGFATRSWQMDSVMTRINRYQSSKINMAFDENRIQKFSQWKAVICPHDDYTYVGWLYQVMLRNIKAGNVLMIGVAHKAKQFRVEDRMVFENFDYWQEPYGLLKSSSFREALMNQLPRSTYIVNDSLHQSEHSLEAIVPYLQYYNRNVQIIPVLIPYMSYKTMKSLSASLAGALVTLMQERDLILGRDIGIVISSDAVHYGCEDWGGSDYAFYGCDTAAFSKAVDHEFEIIGNCLVGEITDQKIQKFVHYTVQDTNYHSYKWTWCGRYSVPFGLLTLMQIESRLRNNPSKGILMAYSTSISEKPIPVDDLKMGTTAKATIRHWVGYAGVGYR